MSFTQVPPNAATRARDRWQEALETGDWAALEVVCAANLVFEDRRRADRPSADRSELIAGSRLIGSSGTQLWRTLLATAGDRLALEHTSWTGITDDLAFNSETLTLTEVDAAGQIVAIVELNPDDRRAASTELFERYARGAGELQFPPAAFELLRATNDHDLERLRAVLDDSFIFHDHRDRGGPRASSDQYIATLATLFDAASDLTCETLYEIAQAKHGGLAMARTFGKRADGSQIDSVYVQLMLYQADRIAAVELFEPQDLELARMRFETLRVRAVGR